MNSLDPDWISGRERERFIHGEEWQSAGAYSVLTIGWIDRLPPKITDRPMMLERVDSPAGQQLDIGRRELS